LHYPDHDQRNAILEGRERKGHPSTSRLVETAEPLEYIQRLELPSTNSEYTSLEMFREADGRTGWKTDGITSNMEFLKLA